MDKRVIFAVAGSGKTTLLIQRLREDRRTLILTFTVNNEAHLRAQIIRRFGYIPDGIRVMTWFEFLHGFCFRPFLQEQLVSRGLSFDRPPPGIPRTKARHYQDPAGRLFHRRLAHLLTARGLYTWHRYEGRSARRKTMRTVSILKMATTPPSAYPASWTFR